MHPHQSLVREFHERFGLTINDTPTLSPKDDALRINLIREELDELKEGIANDDHVEIADALADLRYVILGAGVTYGLSLCALFVVDSTIPRMELALSGVARAMKERSWISMQCGLETLLEDVDHFAGFYGIALDAVFTEVHRSNMSKLWTDAEAAVMAHELAHSDDPSKLTLTRVSKTDERCWLVKRADGKALKSPSYSPADIAGVIGHW